ncbi:hypothetical protein ACFOLF_08955 [Paenibacillus sepulcri]|uniref:DUF2269 family protein n=1 Tax=Paenibacillus sepulcri TaxID=359917 RepID=A0ABS7CEJ4_9BACL|nr:hypothetical protein [Paenibacillus sepulcri]
MHRISGGTKKWLLTLHLLFSAIMLGVTVAFLILSLVAASTSDEGVLKACYASMLLLAETSIRASTIGAVVTGVLLSLLTHWGLFKYYWIIAKLLLTVASIGLGMAGIYMWSLKAAAITGADGLNALGQSDFLVNRAFLINGIIMQLLSLLALFILSVFKPWGKRVPRK